MYSCKRTNSVRVFFVVEVGVLLKFAHSNLSSVALCSAAWVNVQQLFLRATCTCPAHPCDFCPSGETKPPAGMTAFFDNAELEISSNQCQNTVVSTLPHVACTHIVAALVDSGLAAEVRHLVQMLMSQSNRGTLGSNPQLLLSVLHEWSAHFSSTFSSCCVSLLIVARC